MYISTAETTNIGCPKNGVKFYYQNIRLRSLQNFILFYFILFYFILFYFIGLKIYSLKVDSKTPFQVRRIIDPQFHYGFYKVPVVQYQGTASWNSSV